MTVLLKFSHGIVHGSVSGLCRFLFSVTVATLFWLWAAPASAAVSLAASSIEATTATLTITDHTGDWYYKYTSPSGGTCSTKQSGTTVSLTQLSTGTTYTFKAYSNSSCSTVIATAADFLTKPGKPISVHAVGMDKSIRVNGLMDDDSYTHIVAQWKSGSEDWDATNRQKLKWKYAQIPGERGNEITLTGLTNDTSYTVRIRLRNGTGDGAWSELATATPHADKKLHKTTIFEGRFGYYLSNYTGNWSAGYTTSPASDYEYCFARTSPRASVSVGEAHVEKTFIVTAYSDNSCTTRMKNGNNNVAQLTVTLSKLTASNITTTGARLTLQNHSSPWYYRQVSPTSGSCTLGTNNSYFDVSKLSANTNYTFRAFYNDSTCAYAHRVATRTFPTLPPKPSDVAATSGVGSRKLKLTASVTGDGTLKKWQYRQKSDTDTNFGSWKNISSSSTSLSYMVTGLTNGTNYQFKVRAVNDSGTGAESDASTAVAPAAETLTAGSVEATTATLTIANHMGNWYYKANAAPHASCSSSSVSGKTKDLTGLSSNTSYTYKAYSDSGCSTELASATAFLTKPGKPTDVAATAGAGSGKLTLSATVTGGGTLTGWKYQQKEGNNNYGSWENVTSTSKTLNHTVTGLTDGTDYQFKIWAVNATGTGLASDASTAVSPKNETLTAKDVEAMTATLTIGHYNGAWYYKADAAPDSTCKGPVSSGTVEKDLTGLSGNTSYAYKAYSDASCSTELASETFLTKPGKPSTLTVTTRVGSGNLTLSTSVTGSGKLKMWQYKKKKGTGNFDLNWTDISSTSTSLNHTVSGLSDGADYQFKVRAVNATGNGAESDASTAIQPLGETLTASDVEDKTATLTITNHTGDWYYKQTVPTGGSCSTKQTAATVSLTQLSAGTTYTFKAYSDSSCSTELTSETFLTKPGQVTGVAATLGSRFIVTWKAVTGATGYKVQWKSGSEEWDATNRQEAATRSPHEIDGLDSSTVYTVRVAAVNATGDGAWSDESVGVFVAAQKSPTTPAGRWLAHFGSAVAGQTAEMIIDRLDMATRRGSSLTIGGQSVNLDNSPGNFEAGYGIPSRYPYVQRNRYPSHMEEERSTEYLEMTGNEFVLMSSFFLDSGDDDTFGRWSAWGSGAQASFKGGGDDEIEGDLTSALVGTDYESDGLLVGVGLSHTLGDGSFDDNGRTEVDSTMTGIHPYIRFAMSDRVSVWGTMGVGEGEITMDATTGSGKLETDVEMRTGAVGLRGELAKTGGMDLAVKSDYLVTRMDSDEVVGIEAMSVETGRFRVMLEASREIGMERGQTFTPSVEVVLRHDKGDADEGVGVEVRGGIRFMDPDRRLTMKLDARGLVMHEEDDVRNWGVSGMLRVDSDSSGHGLSLSVQPSVGDSSGGTARLWDIQDSSHSEIGDKEDLTPRLSAEVGYGVGALGGLMTPYVGISTLEGGNDVYRLGGRFSKENRLNMNLGVDVEDNSEYRIELQGSIVW